MTTESVKLPTELGAAPPDAPPDERLRQVERILGNAIHLLGQIRPRDDRRRLARMECVQFLAGLLAQASAERGGPV